MLSIFQTGASQEIKLRLYPSYEPPSQLFGEAFDQLFQARIGEADQFYASKISSELNDEERNEIRQGYAGLLWSKQFYQYIVQDWLEGDQVAKPPEERKRGRNFEWGHLYSRDLISMPDKWEYPWFASWDLAFHLIPLAQIDPDFCQVSAIAVSARVVYASQWTNSRL